MDPEGMHSTTLATMGVAGVGLGLNRASYAHQKIQNPKDLANYAHQKFENPFKSLRY